MLLTRRHLLAAGAASIFLPKLALAQQTIDVQMLNAHPDDKKRRMIFDPLITIIQPGDTVNFLSVDRGHNSQSIKGMIPEGFEPWKSKINDDFALTLDVPGFYGYQCTPHATMGMIGLIIVEGEGKLANYEAAKGVKQRGRAKKAWAELWAEVEAQGLNA